MQPSPRTHTTDQQRLTRLSRPPRPQRPVPVGDKALLNRLGSKSKVPKPLVVSHNTWVIRGKDGTYLGFAFGDGRQVQQLNLYDHLPANRVPRLGNYVLDLTGIVPDAIGIDIGGSAGVSAASGMVGLNILWHTRGEGNRKFYPELHVYYGYSAASPLKSFWNFPTFFDTILTPPNASAAVQIILGWARTYDNKGASKPADNAWVANGFNWTGTFWSAGLSVPIPPRFTLVGSYFQSVPFFSEPKNTAVWYGVSFGIGVSGKFKTKAPYLKIDLTKIIDLKKTLAGNSSKTEYGLVYGNGRDFIPQRNNRDITGWHWPVNQNDYPQ